MTQSTDAVAALRGDLDVIARRLRGDDHNKLSILVTLKESLALFDAATERAATVAKDSGEVPKRKHYDHADWIAAPTTEASAEPAAVGLPPIEVEDGRMYIPLPGGWEVQTKGKGSTFRICHKFGPGDDDYRRWMVLDEKLHKPLEAMALAMRAYKPTATAHGQASAATQPAGEVVHAWFARKSEFGPWLECSPSTQGARLFVSADASPVPTQDNDFAISAAMIEGNRHGVKSTVAARIVAAYLAAPISEDTGNAEEMVLVAKSHWEAAKRTSCENFAASVAAIANPWEQAILDCCCVAHADFIEGDARKSLENLIARHVSIVLDPSVSDQATRTPAAPVVDLHAAIEGEGEPVPIGVCFSEARCDFYAADSGYPMGSGFYDKWRDRADDFPDRDTARAALARHAAAELVASHAPSQFGSPELQAMIVARASHAPSVPKPTKSLSASVADALRQFVRDGQKVIWREPFRWHDDQGVMSNHYDGANLLGLAEEFGYEVIVDMRDAGIIAPTPPKESDNG